MLSARVDRFVSLRAKLRRWYEGELEPTGNDHVVIMHFERHWSSRIAHTLVDFYLKEWKWIWGTLIVVGLAIAKLH